jgi:hypothetical protein
MLSTQYLLIRARKVLLEGNALAAAYYCEIAAIHSEKVGNDRHAGVCRRAAEACFARAGA